jgi:hypothetical protein
LASSLPHSLYQGLTQHGVPAAQAQRVAHLPPVSVLFAAFLGYNPIQHLVGPAVLAKLPHAQVAVLTGRGFFSSIISAPFRAGLHIAFDCAIVASLIAGGASMLRGGRYVYSEQPGNIRAQA